MRGRMTSRARAQRLRAIQAQNVKLAERYIARYGHGV